MNRLSGNSPLVPLTALIAQTPAGPTAALTLSGLAEVLSANSTGSAAPPSTTSDRPERAAQSTPAPCPADLSQLTRAVCRGDEAAFRRFYDLYSLPLYKYLLVLAKGDETHAREVLQTVVLKVARKFKVFDDDYRLWGWLCCLARNAYVDLCRAQKRDRRLLPLQDHEARLAQPGEDEHRLSEALGQALESLTAEEQELIRAAYVDERPLQELATASGYTYKAIESRLGRLRRKLKATMLSRLRHEDL